MDLSCPMPRISDGDMLCSSKGSQSPEMEVGIDETDRVAQRSVKRKRETNLSLMGFMNESPLYAFPPTPSFTVSAPELSVDPCLAF